MVAPKGFAWSFRDVFVHSKDRIFFVTGHDESTKKDLPGSGIFRWLGHWDSQAVSIIGTRLTVTLSPEPNVLIMGVNGNVIRWGNGPVTEELLDDSEEGPQNYGDLQEIRTIGEYAYVVGMRRTVYRCNKIGKWARIDHGVRCPEDDESDAGFNSIDGFNTSHIYAVGWNGEIWHYNGKNWRQIESPTNLALFRVICSEDGSVYACGQKGIIMKGVEATWEIIEQDETDETFWGATWFKNSLYLSTSNGLFQLQKDKLKAIDINPKGRGKIKITPNNCFYRLDSDKDIMCSAGHKMVIYTEDGIKWTETPYK